MFNFAHCPNRFIVEGCIGILRYRFRCLQRYRALHYDPARSSDIITACAILNNVCIYCNVPVPETEMDTGSLPHGTDDDDHSSGGQGDTTQGTYRDRGSQLCQKKMDELAGGQEAVKPRSLKESQTAQKNIGWMKLDKLGACPASYSPCLWAVWNFFMDVHSTKPILNSFKQPFSGRHKILWNYLSHSPCLVRVFLWSPYCTNNTSFPLLE